ncbi:hypothetical protein HELRODRAFT_191226 [Helobdella robusta]|uniref:Polypeptide N-acetylgalactosaminyltransferase n=1 Tax=Helobdella robusta TaxID=6412 RepID=T1FSR5_HELRO|nr:hypothetical protein HELRODRAFT_191226 [Helobdella robusta]ESO06887.1 hypothetical protein HELRODRAFT_191226 [Helobdella robusta]
MVASDKISLTRNIPDTRLDECKYWHYPEDLPTASVIIVFHNEGFSTLLRTVHSVIKTSPYRLLKEVVLVDDFSDKIDLKGRLDKYIEQFNGLVKLYRNPERLGLIGTRSKGATLATGDVIVFLDAHCECGKNWLVPLLARIRQNRTTMAVPTIDGIDWNDFHYSPVYNKHSHYRGIFEWGFLYKESEVPKAPTHAGGLFAIDRNYFIELGMYDPGLQIWGGENFELSFKIWQCGGSIVWVPCSRVGHVYRNHMPYGFGKINPKIPVILINYMRVVEVWLDPEFRDYFYTREPTIRGYPIGNISEQLAFKERNKCKSFKWYMDNIAIEVYQMFPPPPPNIGWGEIKLRTESICWDARGESAGGGPIGSSSCHHMGGGQLFRFNKRGQIGYGERCIDKYGSNQISIHYCPVDPSGRWIFEEKTGLIKYGESGLCARAERVGGKLSLESCDPSDRYQSFEIKNIKIW